MQKIKMMKVNLDEKKQLHVELRQVLVFVCHALQMRLVIYLQKSSVLCFHSGW
jgi:hypothetical protein